MKSTAICIIIIIVIIRLRKSCETGFARVTLSMES